jgi:predicted acetyltransferase
MTYRLVRYDEINESEYEDYISEWERINEHVVPWSSKRKGKSFHELMIQWQEDETDIAYANGFVPSTLYFLIDDNNRIIGAIHFRHVLNQRLMDNGGNIGYGIRASERKKGFAALMLNLLLEKIDDGELEKVMVTCDEDNVASAKTIEKCGGLLQDKVMFEDVWTRRYWINLKRGKRRTTAST